MPARPGSPPLQGEGWVGMGFPPAQAKPIPIPAFPLTGKETSKAFRSEPMKQLPWLHPDRVAALESAPAERILVIDAIGRASCRETRSQYLQIPAGAVAAKKKNKTNL